MKFYIFAFLAAFSGTVFADTESVVVKKTYSLDRVSRSDAVEYFKHQAIAEAGKQLPSLLFGTESLDDGKYSQRIQSHAASIFNYSLTEELIDRENNTISLTGTVSFDPQQALNTIKKIKDGIDAQRKNKAFEKLTQELESDKIGSLTELFLKRARAYEKAYDLSDLPEGSDAYIVTKRIAQERILSEAMKDVYLNFLLPAIKEAKKSVQTKAINNLRVDGKALPRYVIEVHTQVPLVSGAAKLIEQQREITWRDELSVVLAPYQSEWPFITVDLIASRMQVCAGTAGLMDNDKFPGFEAIRPDFNTKTMRRGVGKLYVQDATTNTLNSQRGMLGICLNR